MFMNCLKISNYWNKLALLCSIIFVSFALSSCTEKKLKDVLNISAKPQDEFSTFSYPSLTVPKIFDLPAPKPGNADNSDSGNCIKGMNVRVGSGVDNIGKPLTDADSALLNVSKKSGSLD